MTLSSMTGFGRAQGQIENYSWVWEIRSVNGKAMDVRMRIPSGLDAFDQHIKTTLSKVFSRGSINVSLQLQKDSSEVDVKVNEGALDKLINIAKQASQKHDLPMPSIDALLAIRDVVEISTMEEDAQKIINRDQQLKLSLEDAIAALKKSREEEGAATYIMLKNILDEIERLLKEGEKIAAKQPELLKNKFLAKVNALISDIKGFDQDRVTQEVVILATKADVKEETDRLVAHIASAKKLLKQKGPVGRKLDFLTQEFNREANTLCSKSTDIKLSNIGLSLKTAIDQFREQIQNVE